MADSTTSRVLQLLSLLQTQRSWVGSELADRIGVSPRTIRRDVERLRGLGYRIAAERGSIGGYRLEAGSDLPPLLFSEEEAAVLAVGLRMAAVDGAVRGMPDLTMSVLAKLEQVLPPAVRARVRAMQATVAMPGPVHGGELVDPETIAILALACRDSEVVRFAYRSADGTRTERRAEPVALVRLGDRWYLLAWDTSRDDWRTFRLDRLTEPVGTRLVVPRRRIPGLDATAFVQGRLGGRGVPRFTATIRIAAPHAEVDAYLGAHTSGLEDDRAGGTRWTIADDRLEILAGALTWLIWPFEVVSGDELSDFLHAFTRRVQP